MLCWRRENLLSEQNINYLTKEYKQEISQTSLIYSSPPQTVVTQPTIKQNPLIFTYIRCLASVINLIQLPQWWFMFTDNLNGKLINKNSDCDSLKALRVESVDTQLPIHKNSDLEKEENSFKEKAETSENKNSHNCLKVPVMWCWLAEISFYGTFFIRRLMLWSKVVESK